MKLPSGGAAAACDAEPGIDSVAGSAWRPVPFCLVTASAIVFVLFLLRLHSLLENFPYLYSYGDDGAAVLGVLRACEGKPLYPDFATDPNLYLFNFLFYELYGLATRVVVGCGPGVIVFARMISVALLAGMAALLAAAARDARCSERVFIMALPFSPIVGWWAFAIRPDIGGMVALTAALLLFRRALTARRSLVPMALAAAAIMAAWAFKQPYIAFVPLMAVFAYRRSWADVLAFCAICGVLLGLSAVLVGSETYWLQTVAAPAHHGFYAALALRNAAWALVKSTPILILCGAVILAKWRDGGIDEVDRFDVVALVYAAVVAATTAGKLGAADYYHFPFYVTAIVLVTRGMPRLRPAMRAASSVAAAVVLAALCFAYLTGFAGNVSLPVEKVLMTDGAAQIRAAPRPKLVIGEYLTLPWVSGNPEEALADYYTYAGRLADVPTPHAVVVEEQVKGGRFASITARRDVIDHFDMTDYRLQASIGHVQIWYRKDVAR